MAKGTEPIGVPAIPLAVSQAFVVASGSRLSHALRIVNTIFSLMKLGTSDLLFAGTPGLRAIGLELWILFLYVFIVRVVRFM